MDKPTWRGTFNACSWSDSDVPDRRPDFPTTEDFGSFLARWRPELEGLDDLGQRVLGGAILDLAYQMHVIRSTVASWVTAQEALLEEVFGVKSMINGQRYGGAFKEMEARILHRLAKQDEEAAEKRTKDRRFLITTLVAVAAVIVTAVAVLVPLVHNHV